MSEQILELGEAAKSAKDDPEALQQIAEALTPVLEKVAAAVMEVVKEIGKALDPIIKAVVEVFKKFYDALLVYTAKAVDPKWLHYWKHGKKRRTREKYRKRIQRELLRLMRQAAIEAIAE